MKKFTVLQSIYKNDNPAFLSECLNSLYEQTVKADEIVLIKDGVLTSELESVISEWKTKLPLLVVGYEENKGLAYALNFGLSYVSTEYVARMDSDDIAFPNRFEKELEFFCNNDEAKIVGSSIEEFYITREGEVIKRIRKYPSITTKLSKTLYKGTPIAHPTVMAKTELLRKYLYRENTNLNEDIDLWFRILNDNEKIFTIDEALLSFRITDGTFYRRSYVKSLSEFKIYYSNCKNYFGFSFRLIYPFARLLSRFLPYSVNKKLYFSKFRKNLFK